MEVLYARYSKDRHTQFQMKTIIYSEFGMKKVMKQAINASGASHLKRIMQNYTELQAHYKSDVLLKPTYEENKIVFDFIYGQSLDELLLEAALKKKKNEFIFYINLYKNFINEVAMENYSEFCNTDKFIGFFKKKYPIEGLKAFNIPNIDLNLDNIIQMTNGDFKVLDYEWVLDFPVPLEFVAFRAINTFYYAHYSALINFVEISELFELFGINSSGKIKYYTEMSICFADYVGTNQAMEKKNNYLQNGVSFEFRESDVISAQLFYSNSQQIDSFTERNSYKLKVNYKTEILNFSVDSSFKSFRFDPADKKCVIELNGITAYDEAGNELSIDNVWSNALFVLNSQWYFFETEDPQIYFSSDNEFQIANIVISLKYAYFFENDFLNELGQAYTILMDNNDELSNSCNELQATMQEFKSLNEQLIIERDNLVLEKDWFISENDRLIMEKVELKAELDRTEEILNEIKKKYWWRIENRIKREIRKIKGN